MGGARRHAAAANARVSGTVSPNSIRLRTASIGSHGGSPAGGNGDLRHKTLNRQMQHRISREETVGGGVVVGNSAAAANAYLARSPEEPDLMEALRRSLE